MTSWGFSYESLDIMGCLSVKFSSSGLNRNWNNLVNVLVMIAVTTLITSTARLREFY
ncbi:hypothetical protein SAMN05192561_10233 [Halopenitus malekzadehii]|uniref:Uncharacterized protein n=1 Tax=Halopenitus malekzadehii TaxID=1267564 RepID=A0A1H6IEZ5_9EURY|nr:hypothetical protein SAMN05192561_10233 [Halopenitus malekzadehii]